MRNLDVPLDISLSELHLVIQPAIPWCSDHLQEFRKRGWARGIPDHGVTCGGGTHDAATLNLGQLIEENRGLTPCPDTSTSARAID